MKIIFNLLVIIFGPLLFFYLGIMLVFAVRVPSYDFSIGAFIMEFIRQHFELPHSVSTCFVIALVSFMFLLPAAVYRWEQKKTYWQLLITPSAWVWLWLASISISGIDDAVGAGLSYLFFYPGIYLVTGFTLAWCFIWILFSFLRKDSKA